MCVTYSRLTTAGRKKIARLLVFLALQQTRWLLVVKETIRYQQQAIRVPVKIPAALW